MPLRRMIFLAMSVTILFVQEQLLVVLANVQFTMLLIVLFSSVFTLRETLVLIFVYVIVDSLYMGAFNPFYMTPMLLAWSLVPVLHRLVLKRTTDEVKLAIFGCLYGFIYGWIFIPFVMIQTGIDRFWPYLLADLPFEIIMAVSNTVTILWLYAPLYRVLASGLEQFGMQWKRPATIRSGNKKARGLPGERI